MSYLALDLNGGASQDRTDDLLRARQALSQLSYDPKVNWWVWMDLNHRPHPYQGCALTKTELQTQVKTAFFKQFVRTLSKQRGQEALYKEVIQPQVPLRLPCYDFTPVADLAVDAPLRS